MGWRLRRVLRMGPFSWTLSKSGIGWSVGLECWIARPSLRNRSQRPTLHFDRYTGHRDLLDQIPASISKSGGDSTTIRRATTLDSASRAAAAATAGGYAACECACAYQPGKYSKDSTTVVDATLGRSLEPPANRPYIRF